MVKVFKLYMYPSLIVNKYTAHQKAYQDKTILRFEPSRGKANNAVSERVRRKSGCTVTEAGWKLVISDLKRRGSVLSADLRLCFRICRLLVFL